MYLKIFSNDFEPIDVVKGTTASSSIFTANTSIVIIVLGSDKTIGKLFYAMEMKRDKSLVLFISAKRWTLSDIAPFHFKYHKVQFDTNCDFPD